MLTWRLAFLSKGSNGRGLYGRFLQNLGQVTTGVVLIGQDGGQLHTPLITSWDRTDIARSMPTHSIVLGGILRLEDMGTPCDAGDWSLRRVSLVKKTWGRRETGVCDRSAW
jgi:hypothetical protein